SVVFDRAVVAMSLVLSTAATQYLLPAAVRSQMPAIGPIDLFSLATLLSIAGVAALMLLHYLPDFLRSWRLTRGLLDMAWSIHRIVRRPVTFLRILVLATLSQAIICLSIYILSQSLHIDLGLIDCFILMPPVIFLSLMPVSIGGWGVREGAMVFMLGLIGIAAEQALPLSVLVGVT